MENNKEIEETLSFISKKLHGIDYAFIGSINLHVQGFEIIPRDIDILTTPEGIKEIDRILDQFRVKEICFDESEGRGSFRSFYNLNDWEIEILGNVNNLYRDKESLKKKIFIAFEEIELPCIPLVHELETYEKMGRMEKVQMIKKFLRDKSS